MIKHLIQKLLHSLLGAKHSHRRYGSSSNVMRRPGPRRGSSSYSSGYGRPKGHSYYKKSSRSSS
ncbi:hypothetical protein [Paenibacillus sp. YYML68]|uniref:hypothetical protein n=1 Tax=Paenibacillus sp. YYML68 TaxID=2909250 RepID=UPI002492DA9A|nr:hypothetical protein [Paenibacillus sp. YYML68]